MPEPDSGHPLQDPLGVRADEPLPDLPARGGPRLRRADPRPAAAAHRRAPGPAERPHPARADPRLRVRHDSARPLPAGHSPLDRRGPRRVLPRALGPPRPDDDPRRRDHGPGAQALAGRVRGLQRPARLQHGPRLLRVHGGALRQGGDPAVPLHPAEGHPRRQRRRHLPAGLPHHARGVRRGLRQVAEGALQALPRQAAARTTTARTSPRTRRRPGSPRSTGSAPAPRARWWRPSPRTAATARPTSSCSRPRTAR